MNHSQVNRNKRKRQEFAKKNKVNNAKRRNFLNEQSDFLDDPSSSFLSGENITIETL